MKHLLEPSLEKQKWKERGNYYTEYELKQMDLDLQKDIENNRFQFKKPKILIHS